MENNIPKMVENIMDKDLGRDIKTASMIWAATELTKLSAARLVTADFSQTFEEHFHRIVRAVGQEFPAEEKKGK
ncbi:TPA: hypothetical protein EYP66_19875 [Candidatus Poribacteria bacterium]|nr:hypothetical protein [Candidatus Poribacteria bacterium]